LIDMLYGCFECSAGFVEGYTDDSSASPRGVLPPNWPSYPIPGLTTCGIR
jgi:hypothetical protein